MLGTAKPKPSKGEFLLERKAKRRAVVAAETANMREAKRRDGNRCRYPHCDCRRLELRLDACHERHRGMGGNAALDRSEPESILTLCFVRHDEWDRGLIDLVPTNRLTGFYSPTAFYRIDEAGRRIYVGTT